MVILIAVAFLAGCVSPMSKMEQDDLRWYAQDRYQFAREMPESNQDEGFDKVHAYWETIEAVDHVKGGGATLVLDGRAMSRDDAKQLVRDRIKETEQRAGIGKTDYCGRACFWTLMITVKVAVTPVEAFLIGIESPCSNWE